MTTTLFPNGTQTFQTFLWDHAFNFQNLNICVNSSWTNTHFLWFWWRNRLHQEFISDWLWFVNIVMHHYNMEIYFVLIIEIMWLHHWCALEILTQQICFNSPNAKLIDHVMFLSCFFGMIMFMTTLCPCFLQYPTWNDKDNIMLWNFVFALQLEDNKYVFCRTNN